MQIHVCPLSRLEAVVESTGARHVVTLINATTPVPRPETVGAGDHLVLGMNDIVEPMDGHVAPAIEHLEAFLAFLERLDGATPLVIHCWAGVSRSTAAAYVAACWLDPGRDEADLAMALREASPTATPNPRIVALADARLGRQGRMIAAIASIGRGADCFEGTPFAFEA